MLQCVIKANVTLLIFFLNNLSTDVSEVLKSPTIILLLSISSFMSVSIHFMYLGALKMGAYVFISIISYHWIDPFIIGKGKDNPLQYSCLENSMNRGAGRLQSMVSQRVRHDWVTVTYIFLLNWSFYHYVISFIFFILQSLYQSLFYLQFSSVQSLIHVRFFATLYLK